MDEKITLEEHDAKSDARAESIKETIREEFHEHTGNTQMGTPMNIFNENPGMGGYGNWGGSGLGAGVAGGVLGGLLFGNRGFNNWNDGNGGAEGRLQDTINSTAIQTKLASIEAAIPYNEAQVQLALAGQAATITNQLNQGFNSTQNQINQGFLQQTQGQFAIKEAVTTAATAGVLATRDDGDKTRAAIAALAESINANNIATLNRQLATAEAALIEQRAIGRAREVEVNVTQNVNQVQTQAQLQAQLQTLAGAVNALVSNNQEVRQGIINLGSMVGNSQTAANTRVN